MKNYIIKYTTYKSKIGGFYASAENGDTEEIGFNEVSSTKALMDAITKSIQN